MTSSTDGLSDYSPGLREMVLAEISALVARRDLARRTAETAEQRIAVLERALRAKGST